MTSQEIAYAMTDARAQPLVGEVLPSQREEARLKWLRALGYDPADLAGKVIAVAGYKGGIGKTLLALELAYLLGAVLADLDWDNGNASRAAGYRHELRVGAPLLDAIERGRVPRPIAGGPYKADIVPCHPDFEANQPAPDQMAKHLGNWAKAYAEERGCPLVVDTHPGGVPSTFGALSAAHTVVVPAVLAEREMEALAGMVTELRDYPLLLVPNKVPASPPERYITWLSKVASGEVPVAPVISEYRWLPSRKRRMAISSADPVPARARPLVDELHRVGEAVVKHALAAG